MRQAEQDRRRPAGQRRAVGDRRRRDGADQGKKGGRLSLVPAAAAVMLVVGVAVEAGIFRPVERRLLHARGLRTPDGPAR